MGSGRGVGVARGSGLRRRLGATNSVAAVLTRTQMATRYFHGTLVQFPSPAPSKVAVEG